MDKGRLRCVGTSASLDPERKDDLTKFAQKLFDEPFGSGDAAVITGERELHPLLRGQRERKSMTAEEWVRLGEGLARLRDGGALSPEEEDFHLENWNDELGEVLRLSGGDLGSALLKSLSDVSEVHIVATELHKRASGLMLLERLAGSCLS